MRTVRGTFKAVPYSRDHELRQTFRDGEELFVHAYYNGNGTHTVTYILFRKDGIADRVGPCPGFTVDRLNDAKQLITEDIN